MAYELPQDVVDNLVLDAESFAKFMLGLADETVETRTGAIYKTLVKLITDIADAGGFDPFETTAELTASTPTVPKKAAYAADTGKIWFWNGTQWLDTGLSAYDKAINYVNASAMFKIHIITAGEYTNIDQIVTSGKYICPTDVIASSISGIPVNKAFHLDVSANGVFVSQEFKSSFTDSMYIRTSNASGVFPAFQKTVTTTELSTSINTAMSAISYKFSKNMFNVATTVNNSRLSATGLISAVTNAKRSAHIPVGSRRKYTISWSNSPTTAPAIAFFANSTATQGTGYKSLGLVSPVTITVPDNVGFMVINTKHESSVELTNLQIELGETATAYSAYAETSTVVSDAAMLPELKKDYEKIVVSRNLFNEDNLINNYFLSSSTGGLSAAAGWRCSGFIPVVAGKQYTLSGQRARQGISFFPNNTISADPALLYINDTTLPITVTAPDGALFAVLGLESNTAKGWSNLQFEEGSEVTQYVPYGKTITLIDGNYVTTDGSTGVPENSYTLNLGTGSVQTMVEDISAKLNVKVFNPISSTVSSVFNFITDELSGATVRVCGDDAAPVRMLGATLGANHGYAKNTITANAHGKTASDIGSVWTDGTYQWVIIQIISVNSLVITCRDANRAFSSSLPTLTHVSGATSTGNIVPTASTSGQWYPMLKDHKVRHLIDGTENTDQTGKWYFNDSVAILESYDLMEKNAIVEWVIANKGSYLVPYGAESALGLSMNYTFDTDGGCTIPSNFFTYKQITAQDLMFTQAARLSTGVNGNIKYYVPRSVAFTHDSQNFDFSVPTIVDSLAISNRIDFTADRSEAGAAVPDRLIMLNNTIGFAIGYLPVLDAAPDVRNARTSKGIQISTTDAKVYPYLVDGLTTLDAGSNYSCVAYRKYFKRKASRTCDYVVKSEYGDFLFLDWHIMNQVDLVELAADLVGKRFELVEKSANVELLSAVATSRIAVKIGAGTSARLVLKFN